MDNAYFHEFCRAADKQGEIVWKVKYVLAEDAYSIFKTTRGESIQATTSSKYSLAPLDTRAGRIMSIYKGRRRL